MMNHDVEVEEEIKVFIPELHWSLHFVKTLQALTKTDVENVVALKFYVW